MAKQKKNSEKGNTASKAKEKFEKWCASHKYQTNLQGGKKDGADAIAKDENGNIHYFVLKTTEKKKTKKYFGAITLTKWQCYLEHKDFFHILVFDDKIKENDGVVEYSAEELMRESTIPPFKINFNIDYKKEKNEKATKSVRLTEERLHTLVKMFNELKPITKIIFLFLLLTFSSSVCLAQKGKASKKKSAQTVNVIQDAVNQKKPTLMILPSDNWCEMRYFMTSIDNQGTEIKVPNYAQAFQEDTELGQVISKVGGLLTDIGYSIKDVEQELRAMNQRQAEDNVTTSKNNGAAIAESPLDQLKKRTKADILIQLWWKVNKEGADKSVSFTLEAFDAYTSKRIGTSTGTGAASSEIVPVLLEYAVKDNIEDFDKQMLSFFRDINENGREIVMHIKKWDDWEEDLESEFNGEVLLDIIEDWMHENTVNDSYNLSDATENFAQFEQVRIPLANDTGRPIDARSFVSGLQKHLKNNYQIPSKLVIRGLGEANLILGEQ